MSGAKHLDGIIEYAGANTPGWVSNLGIVVENNGIKIVDAGGAALTTGNFGWVTTRSVTAGRIISLSVTAATHLFTSAHTAGEEFGTTAALVWGNDRPFFLYAVNKDDDTANLLFGISPNPCLSTSPATANLGYQSNPMATPSDSGMLMMTASNVTATHNEKPCQLIGAFRMTKAVTTDTWTVTALSNNDGIGPRALANTFATRWDMVAGQMGGETTSGGTNDGPHFLRVSGLNGANDVPTWATEANILYNYWLRADGSMRIGLETSQAAGCTNGDIASNIFIALPYVPSKETLNNKIPAGIVGYAAAVFEACSFNMVSITTPYARLIKTAGLGGLNGSGFSNAADDLYITAILQAF